jgi:4-alpha-glucanotransferase
VLAVKLEALERIWRSGAGDEPGYRAFRAAQGVPLRRWATFAALSERLGPGWQSWPAALRDPESEEVADFARGAADRLAFHAWVQWLLDEQLARAGSAGAGLVNDLPVGFDPGGFDAWDWQPELTRQATIGSPPDRFNPTGQDWGLLPFVPHRLRAAQYRPFIETLRATFRHAAGIRIDHALGLFRTWWVPRGSPADAGAYVTSPSEELLAIIALESERAGAVVIGEDLGTVGAGVRAALARRGVLSTRVAYFERRLSAVPALAQVSITTHDLPTVAGVWSGADLAELGAIGAAHDPAAERSLRRRLREISGLAPDAATDAVIVAAHAAAAATRAALFTATLEDALAVPERPNVPGTGQAQRPNWSLALPIPLETIREDPGVRALAARLASERPLAHDAGNVDPSHRAQDR